MAIHLDLHQPFFGLHCCLLTSSSRHLGLLGVLDLGILASWRHAIIASWLLGISLFMHRLSWSLSILPSRHAAILASLASWLLRLHQDSSASSHVGILAILASLILAFWLLGISLAIWHRHSLHSGFRLSLRRPVWTSWYPSNFASLLDCWHLGFLASGHLAILASGHQTIFEWSILAPWYPAISASGHLASSILAFWLLYIRPCWYLGFLASGCLCIAHFGILASRRIGIRPSWRQAILASWLLDWHRTSSASGHVGILAILASSILASLLLGADPAILASSFLAFWPQAIFT